MKTVRIGDKLVITSNLMVIEKREENLILFIPTTGIDYGFPEVYETQKERDEAFDTLHEALKAAE